MTPDSPPSGALPSRRDVLKGAVALGVTAALSRFGELGAAAEPSAETAPAASPAATPGKPRYNVLFLMSDDMRPELGCYGNPTAKTPNIDALAKSGVLFERNFCQYPLCCPSRSSLLTGRQVINTGVYGNRTWFGDLHPEFVSLPKWFKGHGYTTVGIGKIFHGGIDDTAAWSEGGEPRTLAGAAESDMMAAVPNTQRPVRSERSETAQRNAALSSSRGMTQAQYSDRVIVLEGDGEGTGDYSAADRAIAALGRFKESGEPFFIGCGFVKPHTPSSAPQRFYEMYPLEEIELPVDFASHRTLPEGFPEGCLRQRNADLFIGRDASPEEAKRMIQGYLASIAWVDWNLGRVVDELDRLGLRENTVVCFLADHGFQLGEKGKWSKAGSLWEEGARVPLIISAPGAKGNGQVCTRIVESLNLYPTLVELCGLPMPEGMEGRSETALLDDPKATWDHPAYTVWSEDGKTLTGIGVRVERWRYADYVLGGPMLLDMEADPHQLKNLAHDPPHAEVAARMAGLVQKYKDSALAKPGAATAKAG